MLRPYNAQSGGLGFLNEEGRLIGAGTPTGGDGNTEDAQVHAELAAMLVPVTEHDVTQELAARLSEDLAAADRQSPRGGVDDRDVLAEMRAQREEQRVVRRRIVEGLARRADDVLPRRQ